MTVAGLEGGAIAIVRRYAGHDRDAWRRRSYKEELGWLLRSDEASVRTQKIHVGRTGADGDGT